VVDSTGWTGAPKQAFPEAHRKRIRTTNGLERCTQKIQRRTRVVRIVPNREACPRRGTALRSEPSEGWLGGKRSLDASHCAPAETTAFATIPATESEEGDRAASPTSGKRKSESWKSWDVTVRRR